MKSLAGSSTLKFSSSNSKCSDKYKSCLSIPEVQFLGFAKHVGERFSLSQSSQLELVHPLFSASALPSSHSQTHVEDEDVENPHVKELPHEYDQFKTVRVKFQLQRQCSFGQRFSLVGDDPLLGSWDPSEAMQMNWSDGHVWTLELDMPVGKSIKYKFLLKGGDTMLWQPGEDRALETWETEKTITVVEDWDNPEIQIVREEDPISEPSKEHVADPESLMVAENMDQPSGSLKGLGNASRDFTSDLENPGLIASHTTGKREEQDIEGLVSETYTERIVVAEVDNSESKGRATHGKNSQPDNKMNLVYDAEFPVLVPGLTPMPTSDTEESVHAADKPRAPYIHDIPMPKSEAGEPPMEETGAADAFLESEQAKDSDVPEDESGTGTSDPGDTTEAVFNVLHEDEQRIEEAEEDEGQDGVLTESNNVLEGDLQWGGRTLRKFLANFGVW